LYKNQKNYDGGLLSVPYAVVCL